MFPSFAAVQSAPPFVTPFPADFVFYSSMHQPYNQSIELASYSSLEIDVEDIAADDLSLRSLTPSSVSSRGSSGGSCSEEEGRQAELRIQEFNMRRQKRLMFPPILKRDIRREYARMFVNTMNLCDAELMSKYVRQFCAQTCVMVSGIAMITASAPEPHTYEGNSLIAHVMPLAGKQMPDLVGYLCDVQIVRKKGVPGSALVMTGGLRGTMTARVPHEQRFMPDPIICHLPVPVMFDISTYTVFQLDEHNLITSIHCSGKRNL